jgi:hypothetical protein
MGYEYTVHKYRDLSRWEFRFWDDNDGDIDLRHIVVWDTTYGKSFCVISFTELDNEMGAITRVREYAEIDADANLSDVELKRIWIDAITNGITCGLRRTRRHYA